MGKGSAPRPFSVSREVFDARWDRAFGKKDNSGAKKIIYITYVCHICNSQHTYRVGNDAYYVKDFQYYVCNSCLNTSSFWSLKDKKFDVLVDGMWRKNFTTWDREVVSEDCTVGFYVDDIQMIRYYITQGPMK